MDDIFESIVSLYEAHREGSSHSTSFEAFVRAKVSEARFVGEHPMAEALVRLADLAGGSVEGLMAVVRDGERLPGEGW